MGDKGVDKGPPYTTAIASTVSAAVLKLLKFLKLLKLLKFLKLLILRSHCRARSEEDCAGFF